MPAAVGFVLAGATAGAAVGSVIAFQATSLIVLGAISRKMTDRKLKSLGSQGSTEREVTVRAADAYENFVYGKALVGGLTVYHNAISVGSAFASTAGANNRMVHVIKWAGHRVSSIEYFRLDDRNLDPAVDSVQWSGITYVGSGNVQTGAFRGYDDHGFQSTYTQPTRLRWYMGNQTSADWVLRGLPDWDDNLIGKERAYGVLEIDQVNDLSMTDRVFARGFPSNIQAYVHGKPVFDPRRYSLNRDPQFSGVSSGWFDLNGNALPTSGYTAMVIPSTSVRGVGGVTDTALRTNSYAHFASEAIPVHPSKFYTLQARARQTSGTNIAYLTAAFYTDVGTLINGGGSDASGGFGLGTFHYWGNVGAAFPSVWSQYVFHVGSGLGNTMPSSARYMRVGVLACFSDGNLGVQEIQELKAFIYGGSEQLVDINSNWGWRSNPALCSADYLRNEQFGFGRESRQPVNASRYALNGDPCWRRHDTLNVASHWRSDISSAGGSPISALGAFSLSLVSGAPGGNQAMVAVSSGGSANGIITSNLFPVDPSGIYTMSVFAKQAGGRRSYVSLHYSDVNGGYINGLDLVSAGFSSEWSNYVVSFGSGTAITLPASVRFAQLTLYTPQSYGVNDTTTVWFQEAQIQAGSYIKRYIEPWEQIDWSSVSSAADWCDYEVATPSGTQARFTCNGQGNTGRSYRDNLRDLLGSGNLRLTYTQSGFRMFGGWVEPSVTINEADLRGPLEIKAAADTADRYNTVRASFYDRHNDHKYLPAANFTAAEYVARDNSMQLYEDIDLPYTNDWFGAQRVMAGVLEQGDNQMLVRAPIGWKGFSLQPGLQQAVRVRPMSWTPKYFMLTEIQNDAERSGASAVLREDYQASYTDVATHEYVPRSGSAVSCYAPFVPQVGSVVATPRPDAVRLRWVNPANRSFEWVDVYRSATNAYSGSSLVKSTRTDEWTDQLGVGDNNYTYYYWLRTRDAFGSVSSIYPGLTTSFYASPLVQVANDPEYVFLDDFNYQNVEQLEQRWERVSAPYTAGISFPASGLLGGRVLRADSTQVWYAAKTRVPYDADALYKIAVRVRQVTSLSGGETAVYAGAIAYRADAVTPVDVNSLNNLGSQLYNVLAGWKEVSSFGMWREFSGHLQGHMPWPTSGASNSAASEATTNPKNAARAHDLTRFFSPMFLMNYSNGTAAAEIDYIKVAKVPAAFGVKDQYMTAGGSAWLYGNPGTTSIASFFVNPGSPCLYHTMRVGSEFGFLVPPTPNSGDSVTFFERFDPAYHSVMSTQNSASFHVSARVWVSSAAMPVAAEMPQFNIRGIIYDSQKRPIVSFSPATAVFSHGGPNDFDRWVTLTAQGWVTAGFDVTSYPPPWYVSFGGNWWPRGTPSSFYVAKIEGRMVR